MDTSGGDVKIVGAAGAAGTDFDAFWAAVMADQLDQAPKLVLADWLEERDLKPDLARGLRWCARTGRWPALYSHDPKFKLSNLIYWWESPPVPPLSKKSRELLLPRDLRRAIAVRFGPHALWDVGCERLIERVGAIVGDAK